MSYGLSVINDSSYLQIDSDNPRLCALYRGNYSSGSNTATITFPAPITTAEPPCIFLQNSSSRNDDLYDLMYMTGSPGNWVGFVLRANNINMRPTGKWFAAVFASLASSQYGLRIWNGAAGLLFDSGATPVTFTKANHNWTYQGVVQFPSVGSAYYYANGLVAPLASDEYFMMNPYSRGVVNTQPDFLPRGVRFNYSTNRLEMYIVSSGGAGPWTDQGQPGAIYARLPGS